MLDLGDSLAKSRVVVIAKLRRQSYNYTATVAICISKNACFMIILAKEMPSSRRHSLRQPHGMLFRMCSGAGASCCR